MKLNEAFEKTVTAEAVEDWRYPRFFTENIGETVLITGSDSAHISKVLRMKKGDLAVICDGKGTDMLCRLISTGDVTELEILDKKPSAGEPSVYLRLFQCMPKADKMDFIVQKAVELGASEVIPVLSHRCVSRPDQKSAEKKRERWQRIADEAAKQCGRGRIPTVADMITFGEAVGSTEGTGIIFYECGGKQLGELVGHETKAIDVFIGPEGGFEKDEVALAEAKGITPATLGTRILRCETAPVAAIAVLMNLTGNM